jgi:hypothetical protein
MTFLSKQRSRRTAEPVAVTPPPATDPKPAPPVPAFRRLVVFGSLDATSPRLRTG